MTVRHGRPDGDVTAGSWWRRPAPVASLAVVLAALGVGVPLLSGLPVGPAAITLVAAGTACVVVACAAPVVVVLRGRTGAPTSRSALVGLPRPWGRRVLLGRGPVPPPWSARVPLWIDQGLRMAVTVVVCSLFLLGNSLLLAGVDPTLPGLALRLAPGVLMLTASGLYAGLLLRARRATARHDRRPSPVPRSGRAPVSPPSSGRR